jgi:DNA-binding MarR family transcriptional regulator
VEPLSNRILQGLQKIGLVMRMHQVAAGATAGVSPTQLQTIALIEARGELKVSEIAEQLAVSLPTASDAVSALAKKKLVNKRTDASDGRATRLSLTAEGKKLARGTADWPDFLAKAVQALGPGEQVVFHRGIVKMIRALQEEGRIPVARMCVNCRFFRPLAHAGEDRPHHCDYVDAAFGDIELRVDCGEFEEGGSAEAFRIWNENDYGPRRT